MNREKNKETAFTKGIEYTWRFFSSVKLTISVLLILAAVCIIGTIVPQHQEYAKYVDLYGSFWASFIIATQIEDMYHSWWFQVLLCVLTMNVFICSYDRLSVTWKTIFAKKPHFEIKSFEKAPNAQIVYAEKSQTEVVEACKRILQKPFKKIHVEEKQEATYIFTEKGRWTKAGAYIVHAGVILLLLGGLIGSIFGFDGYMTLSEGDTSRKVMTDNGKREITLDFMIQCDSFAVEFYKSGMPKKYTSILTIFENGAPVLTKAVEVNSPLRYKGVNFFQSSYGQLPPHEVTIKVRNKITEKEEVAVLTKGDTFTITGTKETFTFIDFVPHLFSKDGSMRIDDVFVGIYQSAAGTEEHVLLPFKMPSFDERRSEELVFSAVDMKQDYYTGLQVTRDPGVGVVYVAFSLLLFGCIVVFFIPFKRVCIKISPSGSGTNVWAVITSAKNKMALPQWNRQLAKEISSAVVK